MPSRAVLPGATIKQVPEDFVVHEVLDGAFTGAGEHACFYVEKRGLNTLDVVHEIAAAFAVPHASIGFCGRKDKHAVTRQWFSVPTPRNDWPLPLLCLEQGRHAKKLRPGQHAANHFQLRLRRVDEGVTDALAGLQQGFPNAFGDQRVHADNVQRAQDWLAQRRSHRVSRSTRGWHLSVLRSVLFNEVLGARVQAGNCGRAIAGDVCEDGVPTGPLWGRGRSATRGAAAEIEREALQPWQAVCEALEYAGVDQSRRVFWVVPQGLDIQPDADAQVRVSFGLPAGAYATSMLASCLALHDAGRFGTDPDQAGRAHA